MKTIKNNKPHTIEINKNINLYNHKNLDHHAVYIHDVENVKVCKINNLGNGVYAQTIRIKIESDIALEINLFSKDKKVFPEANHDNII